LTKKEIQVDILRPFGPRILKATVPEIMVDALNAQCDELLQNDEERKQKDASGDLVGHVFEELTCDLAKSEGFGNFLYSSTKALYTNFLVERGEQEKIEHAEKIAVHHAWFVRSFENDYNPTHIHTNGSFSCVLYLKIPPGISDKNSRNTHEKYATEGYIDFVYGSSSTVNPGNMCIQPKVGDLYIFPASLFHTVYPFYGEGERRSFSANMSLQKGE
jgi:hypothetical protein